MLTITSMAWCTQSQPIEQLVAKSEYLIAMRDGVRLYTAVYTPRHSNGNCPILLTRTPYSCNPYGANQYSNALMDRDIKAYIDKGYIVVMQDVRGCYMSEGDFEHIRPFVPNKQTNQTDEASDTYDTVEFLIATVEGNNGCVGVKGCSYPGYYALMAALSGHPAIKAVSPQAPVTDWFMGDDVHHNGALALADAFSFISWFDAPRKGPEQHKASNPINRLRADRDFYNTFPTVDTLTQLMRRNRQSPFWEQLIAHPDYDEWWQQRDTRRYCYNIAPAVLVVGGLYDAEDCYGAMNLYRAVCAQSPATECYITIGPWNHGGWLSEQNDLGRLQFGTPTPSEFYLEQIEMPFFDRYLKGDTAATPLAQATVYVTGENSWHRFDSWPARESRELSIYLQPDFGLDTLPPTTAQSVSCYRSDPFDPVPYNNQTAMSKSYMYDDQSFTSERSDVLHFVSEPLSEPLTIVGAPTVQLTVSITTTDADFVVKLLDCYPESEGDQMSGYRLMVRGDIMRGRYRNSFSSPEPFIPNQPTTIEFEMADVAHCFETGHRIAVEIESTWYPLFDRNPQRYVDNIYRAQRSDYVESTITIFHQSGAASRICTRAL